MVIVISTPSRAHRLSSPPPARLLCLFSRLINGAENIKKMFDALITTLPGLTNVGMLLALMFFIYSVVGVQLFATVAYNGDFNASADFR